MKQVEEALHQLHARDKEKQARDIAEAREEARNRRLGSSSPAPPQAFARVNSISPGSPASIAVILPALPHPLLAVLSPPSPGLWRPARSQAHPLILWLWIPLFL